VTERCPVTHASARFKGALAAAVNDLDIYTDVKDPVVDLVVTVAGEWATATGWSPERRSPSTTDCPLAGSHRIRFCRRSCAAITVAVTLRTIPARFSTPSCR
jgi:hypothetical protein